MKSFIVDSGFIKDPDWIVKHSANDVFWKHYIAYIMSASFWLWKYMNTTRSHYSICQFASWLGKA